MSDHPLIVLEGANTGKLRRAYLGGLDAGLTCNAFVLDMKDGKPVDQEAAVSAKHSEALLFVAVGLWGEYEAVLSVTKHFSLYR
jgi:hypothetical protein